MIKVNQKKLNKIIERREKFDWLDVSKKTREDYDYSLKEFLKWIKEEGGISKETFMKYKRHLNKKSLAISTKNKYLVAAKIFLGKLYKDNIISEEITVLIKGFKGDTNHKKTGLNDEEIQKMMVRISRMRSGLKKYRLQAILAILIYQGFRGVEIERLDRKDINLEEERILVQGKGKQGKTMVIMHKEVKPALEKYINIANIKDGPLFQKLNKSRGDKRLTRRGMYYIITNEHKQLKINKGLHAYRHYFVTNLLRHFDKNIIKVQQLSRHKSVQMLQVYNDEGMTRQDQEKYQKAFSKI